MNRLLSIFAFCVVALPTTVATPAWANPQDGQQGPPRGGGRRMFDPDQQVKMLSKKLNLSDDQQSQIRKILMDQASQMKSIRADSSLQPEDRREKMRSLMADTNSKIEGVLNDKQKDEFKKIQQERRDRMQNRGGGGAGPQD